MNKNEGKASRKFIFIIDDEWHKLIKLRALHNNESMKSWIMRAIKEAAMKENKLSSV